MRVIVVGDSKTMRNILQSIVTELGYTEVEKACSGPDALTKVAAFNPDLLLLDWIMPKMDGLTFLKTYRAQGNKTPTIFVTTANEKTRVIEAIKAGVNNYVVKPFTPDILGERISETMAKVAASPQACPASADIVSNMIRQFRPIQDQARAILAKRRGVKVETIDLPAGWQHDLRRTYAMQTAEAVPMQFLQKYMGHQDIGTTAKFYLGVTNDAADRARSAVTLTA